MTFKTAAAGVLAGLLLTGAAFAQAAAPSPAAPATPAASASPMPAGGMDKKAIAKACSDDATKQGLHGKERKAFRSKCKREKMKAM